MSERITGVGSLVYGAYDQAALDIQYSPSSRTTEMPEILAQYASRSSAVRSELSAQTDLQYGKEPCERLDLFPGKLPGAPLVVFVHGGYWQELSKDDSSFPARGLVDSGAAFAAVGYGLAPRYRLDEIVEQIRCSLEFLIEQARELGFDPARIHLVGHCAGAHLVLMSLLDDWRPGGKSPAEAFAGATLISGVYDLEPLSLTYVNEPLGLDRATARRLSPIHRLPDRFPPLIVARGGAETDEFCRQHDLFVEAATARAETVRALVATNRNHFDVAFDLSDPATGLGTAQLEQLGIDAG
ncbi:alpha/beta hydrolase [Streptomyces sp. NPDC006372]|uniref:alpha/beta hydrolase n=1 Tax=Streptomyces sp. NPDC006372 TaxID=3155599 RepID=UPI0033BC7DF0